MQAATLSSEFNFEPLLRILKTDPQNYMALPALREVLPALMEAAQKDEPAIRSVLTDLAQLFGRHEHRAWLVIWKGSGENPAIRAFAQNSILSLVDASKNADRTSVALDCASAIDSKTGAGFRNVLVQIAQDNLKHITNPLQRITAIGRMIKLADGDAVKQTRLTSDIVAILGAQPSIKLLPDKKPIHPRHDLTWKAFDILVSMNLAQEGSALHDVILEEALKYTNDLPQQRISDDAKHIMDHATRETDLRDRAIEKSFAFLSYRETPRQRCNAAEYLWHRARGGMKKRIGNAVVDMIEAGAMGDDTHKYALDFMKDITEHLDTLATSAAKKTTSGDTATTTAQKFLDTTQPQWGPMLTRLFAVAERTKPIPVTLANLPEALAALNKK